MQQQMQQQQQQMQLQQQGMLGVEACTSLLDDSMSDLVGLLNELASVGGDLEL
jgi:hypothetical protein